MAVSSKGMRRVVLAGGGLHLLTGSGSVVVQVRSPHLTSDADAVGPACKVGVVLDRQEAWRLSVELLGALRRMTAGEG